MASSIASVTTDTTNYTRIHLILMKGGTLLTKTLFLKRVKDLSPAGHELTVDEFLGKHRVQILSTSTGRNNEEKLYPPTGTTNLDEWDLPLYCFILKTVCDLLWINRMDIKFLKTIRNELSHLHDPSLTDADFKSRLSMIEPIFTRSLQIINDPLFEGEMTNLVQRCKTGALSVDEVVKIHHDSSRKHIELLSNQLKIMKNQVDILQNQNIQNIQLATALSMLKKIDDKLPSGSDVDIPDVRVIIEVKNCSRDKEQELLDFLVKQFNETISKPECNLTKDFPNLAMHTISEAICTTLKEFLAKGRHVLKVEKKCISLTIKCISLSSFVSLVSDCIDGSLLHQLKNLKDAIRRWDGCAGVDLDPTISPDDTSCAILKIATNLDEKLLGKDQNDVQLLPKEHLSTMSDDSTSSLDTVPLCSTGSILRLTIKPDTIDCRKEIEESFVESVTEGLEQFQNELRKDPDFQNLVIEAKLLASDNGRTGNDRGQDLCNTLQSHIEDQPETSNQNFLTTVSNEDLGVNAIEVTGDENNQQQKDAWTASAALSSVWMSFHDKLHDNQIKPIIVQIPTDDSLDQVPKPDLRNDQKRWLIVGICLHSVIFPTLRNCIKTTVGAIYNSLVKTHQIDKQGFHNYMRRYMPTNKELNYESINNNRAVPREKGKPDIAKYDYSVRSDVDFSKLFLPTFLTNYNSFDSSCDSSPLLAIIINIDFPIHVKKVAEQVRRDLRNPWSSCRFSEWDVIKYQNSFQLMYQLVKSLQLPGNEEAAQLGMLMKWQTNGIQWLQGTTIGIELLQTLKEETRTLSKYLLDNADKNITNCHQCVVNIDKTLNETEHTINKIKEDQFKIKGDRESLSNQLTQFQISQVRASLISDQSEASTHMEETKVRFTDNQNDIKVDVEKQQRETDEIQRYAKNEGGVLETKTDVLKNNDAEAILSKKISCSRGLQNAFFFIPDRMLSFVARDKEIKRIQIEYSKASNRRHTQVICGPGGIGKTTLSVEFAWRYRTCYPAGIFWMSAESNDALEDYLQSLAIQIGKVGTDIKDTIKKVLNWLSSLQDQWLLIIDNVDVDELFGATKEVVLGRWNGTSKGHVMITSRRGSSEAQADFNVTLSDCITLDVLSVSESRQFMIRKSCVNADKNDSSLDKLVCELGGLPLALEQASAHIKAIKCTYQDYLEKFEIKQLQFLQKSSSPIIVPKERRTILTTCHLNFDLISKQSEDEGLGTAALTAIKVSAYLYADDIPLCIFNVRSSKICDENNLAFLQKAVGTNQIPSILLRFSLFRESGLDTLSVHRLVQEVVREGLTDVNEKKTFLEYAVRMVSKALEITYSPLDAIKEKQKGRNSLQVWSKLCYHANTVRKHLFEFARENTRHNNLCFNIETTRLLKTCSIYHSLNQRQNVALACQDQMFSIFLALDISELALRDFTNIKIPLLNRDRFVIQDNLIANAISQGDSGTDVFLDPETLRKIGNIAFDLNKYHTAIQCYSEALRLSDKIDLRVLVSRSLAHLKVGDFENVLIDAERCIVEYQDNKTTKEIETDIFKAYLWKAYAIANLIRQGKLPQCYEFIGLASAAVAGYLNSKCLLEYMMKIEYPVVRFSIIENETEFANAIASLHNTVYTTLLLREGCYEVPPTVHIVKSIQVIGIEDGVKIVGSDSIRLIKPKTEWFTFEIRLESELNILFENVSFPIESGVVLVGKNVNVTFYRCRFSNGKKACEDFPICNGGVGCRNTNPLICKKKYAAQEKTTARIVSGESGSPGLGQYGRGKVVVDSCILDRCGGGGTCCEGEGAFMVIKNSVIKNMRQMGVEARYGGNVQINNCTIVNNQFHGVAIGPRGFGQVEDCIIRCNNEEGIWCGEVVKADFEKTSIKTELDSDGGSVCIIKGNLISHNDMSGLSFDGGSYEVSGNRIFENWLWGIMVKSRSAASIYNNDVFANKCGGIRVGVNYSAPVEVDGNTIRDHTGPAIYIADMAPPLNPVRIDKWWLDVVSVEDAIGMYSVAPFITTRNVFLSNDKGQHTPREILIPVQTCCFCHNISDKLRNCGNCKRATYCSKECQAADWKRHKNMCPVLFSTHTIEIEISKTKPLSEYFLYTVPLPDLGKGTLSDRNRSRKFIVKIQCGNELTPYHSTKYLSIRDQTQNLCLEVRHPILYHLVCECGVLLGAKPTTKKIYCWASFKNKGSQLCIHTDNLPPFQRW